LLAIAGVLCEAAISGLANTPYRRLYGKFANDRATAESATTATRSAQVRSKNEMPSDFC
jgi:hypothetical protein